ncbi:hypothetical protein BJX96DRAFT_160676 [Aspergillus floccosus]
MLNKYSRACVELTSLAGYIYPTALVPAIIAVFNVLHVQPTIFGSNVAFRMAILP